MTAAVLAHALAVVLAHALAVVLSHALAVMLPRAYLLGAWQLTQKLSTGNFVASERILLEARGS